MKPLILAALAALGVAVWLVRLARTTKPEPDQMARPFLDSHNSATYLYNPRTGVLSSYN